MTLCGITFCYIFDNSNIIVKKIKKKKEEKKKKPKVYFHVYVQINKIQEQINETQHQTQEVI